MAAPSSSGRGGRPGPVILAENSGLWVVAELSGLRQKQQQQHCLHPAGPGRPDPRGPEARIPGNTYWALASQDLMLVPGLM